MYAKKVDTFNIMLPNLEPTVATDQFLHMGLYMGRKNFLTFVLNLGVGFYSSMGLDTRVSMVI